MSSMFFSSDTVFYMYLWLLITVLGFMQFIELGRAESHSSLSMFPFSFYV